MQCCSHGWRQPPATSACPCANSGRACGGTNRTRWSGIWRNRTWRQRCPQPALRNRSAAKRRPLRHRHRHCRQARYCLRRHGPRHCRPTGPSDTPAGVALRGGTGGEAFSTSPDLRTRIPCSGQQNSLFRLKQGIQHNQLIRHNKNGLTGVETVSKQGKIRNSPSGNELRIRGLSLTPSC